MRFQYVVAKIGIFLDSVLFAVKKYQESLLSHGALRAFFLFFSCGRRLPRGPRAAISTSLTAAKSDQERKTRIPPFARDGKKVGKNLVYKINLFIFAPKAGATRAQRLFSFGCSVYKINRTINQKQQRLTLRKQWKRKN